VQTKELNTINQGNLKRLGGTKYSRNLQKKIRLENYIELLKLILPELILEHFNLVNTKVEQ
jgi:hypothetical protein